MQQLDNKVAVVTGAASGIGQALAARLAFRGMRVVLADIEPEALATAAGVITGLGGTALPVVTDVTDPAQVDRLAARAAERFGNVHVLVNNAGVGVKGRAWELALGDWQWVMGVCFWGVVHGVRSFVPDMVAHGEECHIVNTSSMMGLAGAPLGGPYQAAKHAVTALTESLAFDLQASAPQIGVTLLCPGYVDTRIADSERNRPARFGRTGPTGPGPAGPTGSTNPPASARPVPAETIADLAVAAILEGRFYAMADWEIWQPLIAARFDAVLAGEPPVPVRLP